MRWRKQALSWLEADLSALAVRLDSGESQARTEVAKLLGRWRVDPALSVIRDDDALAKLPEAERQSLRDLWLHVDKVRATAIAAAPTGKRKGEL